jgi:DNA polymerase-3 subunit epsilon
MVSQAWFKKQRQDAAEWAHELLRREFVIFDGETTGMDADDEFVQVGAIDHSGVVLLDTLVKPAKRISPQARAVHGLTAAHVAGAPGFANVHPELEEALSGRLVVAYNADFDSRILWQACDHYGLSQIEPSDWDCAMKWYAQYYGSWSSRYRSFRWKKLVEACVLEGVEVHDAHAAVDDCLLTLRLIQKMAASLDDSGQT